MFVLTSNLHKIREYKEFGIEAKLGDDILEVLGTVDEVIIYKILSVGPNTLVEDTILEIAGQHIVDTKFRMKSIKEHNDASWITSLGYHNGVNLYVYRGIIKGRIVPPIIEHDMSFEPCFVPAGLDMTLYELKQKGMKQEFSARRLALEAFQDGKPTFSMPVYSIPEWKGKYQDQKLR